MFKLVCFHLFKLVAAAERKTKKKIDYQIKHEFMDEDLSDSNSSVSDSLLSPTVTSSTTCLTSGASSLKTEVASLPQMVCGLPYADLYSLPPGLASVPVSLASLTPLPPMSISATNWWPASKPEFPQ